jgi:hypothetical protein
VGIPAGFSDPCNFSNWAYIPAWDGDRSFGRSVAGAEVSLDNTATGFHASHSTDASGAYEFPQISPGKYTITVTTAGFGRQSKQAELLVSQPATINFQLSVQA